MTSAAASEPKRSKAEKFWDRLARTWSKPTAESGQTDTRVLAKTRPARPSDAGVPNLKGELGPVLGAPFSPEPLG